ncbi:uncharacterized protein LOC118797924 [Colossoma macropomum]|uniref:uncharacterized protein LOC118797924 n=1 Tax=Colossoma macropomum TaxID=42526 RepID=UPI0018648B99|nr:uncharacterized protein LOC118797924 [Colossoma macropomum]
MVLSGALRVVLLCLLSLCLRGAEVLDRLRGNEVPEVNPNTLACIINDLHTRYNPQHGHQFALAINVPVHYCVNEDSKLDKDFLKNDDPTDAIQAMNNDDRVYVGTSLIGATKKKDGKTLYHSEYLLLKQKKPDETPMQMLLKQNRKGCVIFYTYYSPCLGTCLNPANKKFNIFTALKEFGEHQGPKALVFRELYGKEERNQFEKAFQSVNNENVPLYRCDNTVCNSCVEDGKVKAECLPQRSCYLA